MKYHRLIVLPLLVVVMMLLQACGSGTEGGATTSVTFSSGAVISIEGTGYGKYTVKADNLSNVSGVSITLHYDPSHMSSPSLTIGNLLTSALTASNIAGPDSIRMAAVTPNLPISGSGEIFTVSFANDDGTSVPSLDRVYMIDRYGNAIP